MGQPDKSVDYAILNEDYIPDENSIRKSNLKQKGGKKIKLFEYE